MRHIENAHDAKDQRQPDRDEEDPSGIHGPVNKEAQEAGHLRFASLWTGAAITFERR